ncbi:hypothetical protein DAI22_03g359900 [Oryza sativa Japonica Group]|jgi:hypothetical protein|nr:hypothetical protein DAI22_03g359900 [Oryza sativa Japonica Group]
MGKPISSPHSTAVLFRYSSTVDGRVRPQIDEEIRQPLAHPLWSLRGHQEYLSSWTMADGRWPPPAPRAHAAHFYLDSPHSTHALHCLTAVEAKLDG